MNGKTEIINSGGLTHPVRGLMRVDLPLPLAKC